MHASSFGAQTTGCIAMAAATGRDRDGVLELHPDYEAWKRAGATQVQTDLSVAALLWAELAEQCQTFNRPIPAQHSAPVAYYLLRRDIHRRKQFLQQVQKLPEPWRFAASFRAGDVESRAVEIAAVLVAAVSRSMPKEGRFEYLKQFGPTAGARSLEFLSKFESRASGRLAVVVNTWCELGRMSGRRGTVLAAYIGIRTISNALAFEDESVRSACKLLDGSPLFSQLLFTRSPVEMDIGDFQLVRDHIFEILRKPLLA